MVTMSPLFSEHITGLGNKDPTIYLAEKDAKKIPFTDFLNIMCCPTCHNDFTVNKKFLICIGCKRKYPIENGIPNMVIK